MAEVTKIRGRSYYSFKDTNGVYVTIPQWYRLTLATGIIVYFCIGVLVGWWLF